MTVCVRGDHLLQSQTLKCQAVPSLPPWQAGGSQHTYNKAAGLFINLPGSGITMSSHPTPNTGTSGSGLEQK